MRTAASAFLGCVVASLLTAALLAPQVRAEKVPCLEVVSELNHRISRGMDRDPKRIAKRLDTEIEWVEECLRLHGRRVGGPSVRVGTEERTPSPFDPNELEDPFAPTD